MTVQQKRPVLSVSQLNFYIKNIFDNEEILHNICLSGEAFDFREVKGIVYFTLRDENAQIDCVCFSAQTVFAERPAAGSRIILIGSPTFYAKGGKVSFSVRALLEEKKDEGDLLKNFLALKEKLTKEGLFDISRKVGLPPFVKKIAVITSETGAVIKDIISVARRRNSAVNIVLYPAQVQGAGAAKEIERALYYADSSDADVIIIARGGGSAEDLAAFNEERLIRAVADTKKPVISAVGHETDTTLCDYAADLRAPTPSAAAELAVYDQNAEIAEIKRLQARLCRAADYIIEKNRAAVKDLFYRIESAYKEKFRDKVTKDGKIISSIKGISAGDALKIYLKDGIISVTVSEVEKK